MTNEETIKWIEEQILRVEHTYEGGELTRALVKTWGSFILQIDKKITQREDTVRAAELAAENAEGDSAHNLHEEYKEAYTELLQALELKTMFKNLQALRIKKRNYAKSNATREYQRKMRASNDAQST